MDTFFSQNEIRTDSLTGAYSKSTISSYASYLIQNKIPFSYAILDVDNFTYITDAFGQEGGNKVLYDVAAVINKVIAGKGTLARNNGDEFSIILKEIVDYDEIWNICHTILVKINEIDLPDLGNQTLTVTIGLACYPENATDSDELVSCAEKALYRGKTKGRNCFIIYLPEKHASIVPKNEKQRAFGALNLHSNVFKFLTRTDDLATGINNLFGFISSYFQIDHVCIQSEGKLLFQKIHQMSKTKNYEYIPHELIIRNMNQQMEVLYIGDTKNLIKTKQIELYEYFEAQEITSACFCKISYRDKLYGMLRVDMTGSNEESRLLQYTDMDVLLTTSKTIALLLNYTGKRLEDLVS